MQQRGKGLLNSRSCGLILNTFEELDGSILAEIRNGCLNLYAVDPLHAHLRTKLLSSEMTLFPSSSLNSLWPEDRSCLAWLDKQPRKSVIYVSFGSIATLTKQQLMEFWHGLVNSEQRFLWVFRQEPFVVVFLITGEILRRLLLGDRRKLLALLVDRQDIVG